MGGVNKIIGKTIISVKSIVFGAAELKKNTSNAFQFLSIPILAPKDWGRHIREVIQFKKNLISVKYIVLGVAVMKSDIPDAF